GKVSPLPVKPGGAVKQGDLLWRLSETRVKPIESDRGDKKGVVSYKLGQVVQARFILKNTGSAPVVIASRGVILPGDYKAVRVIDEQDTRVPIHEESSHSRQTGSACSPSGG